MHKDEHLDPDLQEVASRLREEKVEASALELDQIKLRAKARAPRAKGMPLKARLVTSLVVLGLVGSGGGAAVIASSGHSSSASAANAIYCPTGHTCPHKPPCPPGHHCGVPPHHDGTSTDTLRTR